MEEQATNSVVQRLEHLERENRRLKRLGGFLIFGVAAVVLMGETKGARVIEAEKFVLRDLVGKTRAVPSTMPDGSVGLAILSADGKSLSLSAEGDGTMGLTMYDKSKKLRAEIFTLADGSAGLALYDASGKAMWKAP